MLVLEALEFAFDAIWEIGVAWLPAVGAGVLASLDVGSVLAAFGLFDVNGADLWHLVIGQDSAKHLSE